MPAVWPHGLATYDTTLKILFRLFIAFLVLASGIALAAYHWAHQPIPLQASTVDFRIPAGNSLRSATRIMTEAGITVSPQGLIWLGRVTGVASAIKAGSYEARQGITPLGLLHKLSKGDVSQSEIRLLEGWTFRQWRDRLDSHPDLRHDTKGMDEASIAQRLGVPQAKLEGLLFPDTYLFDKHSSDLDLLARAYRVMNQRLQTEWDQRAPNLPYQNLYQALVMASIVEKETGTHADRPIVAAVFVNRLRLGMLLQTDPTVIYGIGETFDGNIRKRDLQTDTPYNTYTRAGLPPTPIAMPGLASVQAALHPASSDALYFVARGDGSSEFSRTLEEHNRAVNRYQRGNR